MTDPRTVAARFWWHVAVYAAGMEPRTTFARWLYRVAAYRYRLARTAHRPTGDET